jgi:hypothetical protein
MKLSDCFIGQIIKDIVIDRIGYISGLALNSHNETIIEIKYNDGIIGLCHPANVVTLKEYQADL